MTDGTEVVEEQNPLKISIKSRFINNHIATDSNSAGRPKKRDEIKFGPQPKSIVSQLLKAEKATQENKQIEKSIHKEHEIPENCNGPEQKKRPKPQETKIYHCEYPPCTYSTKLSSNMIKHKRRHTSEKPYMCDQCTFRTNFINSLTVHKRIHSGERPFICEHCCYRCNSSSNLKKHCMHKHSGIT